jgi:hypothetical protein
MRRRESEKRKGEKGGGGGDRSGGRCVQVVFEQHPDRYSLTFCVSNIFMIGNKKKKKKKISESWKELEGYSL